MTPPPGWDKCNFDIATGRAQYLLDIGMVAHNSDGSCIGWNVLSHSASFDSHLGELLALKATTQIALKMGWDRVIFEGDNQLMVLDINTRLHGHADVPCPLGDSVALLLRCFSYVVVNFVPREANVLAHNVAHFCNCLPSSLSFETNGSNT